MRFTVKVIQESLIKYLYAMLLKQGFSSCYQNQKTKRH